MDNTEAETVSPPPSENQETSPATVIGSNPMENIPPYITLKIEYAPTLHSNYITPTTQHEYPILLPPVEVPMKYGNENQAMTPAQYQYPAPTYVQPNLI